MIILDTNAILRLATSDLPKEAKLVKGLVDAGVDLTIPEVVFPEIEYNLKRGYGYSRDQIGNIFGYLASLENVRISSEVLSAIKLFNSSKLDMADCVIAAYAKDENVLASFDNELLKVSGVKSYFK